MEVTAITAAPRPPDTDRAVSLFAHHPYMLVMYLTSI